MKKVTLGLALLFCCTLLFGQEMSVDCDLQNGTWSHLYHKIKKTVVKLNKNGQLEEILFFETEEETKLFMRRPRENNKPSQSLKVAGILTYFENYESVSYYAPREYHTGSIKRIGNMNIRYYTKYEYHTNRLKQIGNINITYYSKYEYNTGRVKRIGGITLKYYSPYEHHNGRLKSIGSISMDYYSPYEHNTGKLKKIGNLKIKYFGPWEHNTGQFKKIDGIDQKVKLL